MPIGFSLDRKLAETSYQKETLPRFNRLPSSKWEVPLLAVQYARKKSVVLETEGLGPRRFHGRIAILINEHTTCAAVADWSYLEVLRSHDAQLETAKEAALLRLPASVPTS